MRSPASKKPDSDHLVRSCDHFAPPQNPYIASVRPKPLAFFSRTASLGSNLRCDTRHRIALTELTVFFKAPIFLLKPPND